MCSVTAPDGNSPAGSLATGLFTAWQATTEEQAKSNAAAGVIDAWQAAQDAQHVEVRTPLQEVYVMANAAQGSADQAVTDAQAAANSAAAAESTAASAYKAASYWESEFVDASAAVVLGVNELLIGLCQNVPVGLTRKITDMHVAFLTQPNGMTFELKKWNAAGTSDSVVDTFTLGANVTRANWSFTGGYEVFTRERLFVNVTSITGTVAPVVFQILVFGVLYDPTIQDPLED